MEKRASTTAEFAWHPPNADDEIISTLWLRLQTGTLQDSPTRISPEGRPVTLSRQTPTTYNKTILQD